MNFLSNSMGKLVNKESIANIKTKLVMAAKKARKIGIIIIKIIQNLILFFTSPIGWIIVGGIIAILVVSSVGQTFGPTQFRDSLEDNRAIPSIASVTGDEKEKTILTTFVQRGVNPELSAYFTKLMMDSDNYSYAKINGENITGCNTACMSAKIKNKEIKNGDLELGALKIKGKVAFGLIASAEHFHKEWTDPDLQFRVIADSLGHFANDASDNSDEHLVKSIQKARSELGMPALQDSVIKSSIANAKDLSEKYDIEVKKAKVMGDGSGKGRLDGGGALGGDDGGGGIGTGSSKLHFPAKGVYTSLYGPRCIPDFGCDFHTGIDISGAGSAGTDIKAAFGGKVVIAGFMADGYGNYVKLEHGKINGKTIQTLYAHMSKLKVKKGQNVKQAQALGLQGSTGRSTGAHLHFEIYINGERKDPKPYLDKATPY